MTRNTASFAIVALFAALSATALRADEPSAAEVRMRETLKATMLQLRDAQNSLATSQAAEAEDKQKIDDLTAQTQTLTQQAISDKQAASKTIEDLKTKNTAQAAQLDAYKKALAQWEAGYKLAAAAAKTREAARLQLTSDKILLQRRVDDLETKNMNLFQIASEILTRYEKFGLGEALAAKEPFVGVTRVKLENQVQDYQDKLLNQKSVPQTTGQTPPQPAAQQPAAQTAPQANQKTAQTK